MNGPAAGQTQAFKLTSLRGGATEAILASDLDLKTDRKSVV